MAKETNAKDTENKNPNFVTFKDEDGNTVITAFGSLAHKEHLRSERAKEAKEKESEGGKTNSVSRPAEK